MGSRKTQWEFPDGHELELTFTTDSNLCRLGVCTDEFHIPLAVGFALEAALLDNSNNEEPNQFLVRRY